MVLKNKKIVIFSLILLSGSSFYPMMRIPTIINNAILAHRFKFAQYTSQALSENDHVNGVKVLHLHKNQIDEISQDLKCKEEDLSAAFNPKFAYSSHGFLKSTNIALCSNLNNNEEENPIMDYLNSIKESKNDSFVNYLNSENIESFDSYLQKQKEEIAEFKKISNSIFDDLLKDTSKNVLIKSLIKGHVNINTKILKSILIKMNSSSLMQLKSQIIKDLIEAGADINVQLPGGQTLLIMAILNNNLDLAKYLVEKGADLNIQDNFGRTALHHAIINKDLLSHLDQNVPIGKYINKDFQDRVSRDIKDATYQKNPSTNKYVNQNDSIRYLNDLHMYTINHPEIFNIKNKVDFSFAKYLVEKGVNVNIKDIRMETALNIAVFQKDLDFAKFLVEKGADLNVKDVYQHTVLIKSIMRNYLDFAKFLVEKGADLNAQDSLGSTALYHALINRDFHLHLNEKLNMAENISQIMMQNQWSLNAFKSPDMISVAHTIAKYLHEHPEVFNIKNKADFNFAKYLIEKGADVNIKNFATQETILDLCIYQKDLDFAKYIIENRVNINIEHEQTIAILSCFLNKKELSFVQYLIEKGVKIKGKSKIALLKLLKKTIKF